jgi:methyl-accepting chemotaxis protein
MARSGVADRQRDEEEAQVNWTVSRRIIAGFAIGAMLVLVMAIVGIWALRTTSGDFGEAVRTERDILLPAVEARGAVRVANISYLRYMVAGGAENRAAIEPTAREAREALVTLRNRAQGDNVQVWAETAQVFEQWFVSVNQMLVEWDAGNSDAALALRLQSVQPTRERLETLVAQGVANARQQTDRAIDDAQGTADGSERAVLIVLLLAALVFIVTAYLLNNAVSAPLQETSNVLATSAAEILATTTQQASGATESLAAVTQTAATVDQVVQTAEQASERARTVAQSAQHAAEISRQGRQAVEASVDVISEVRSEVDAIGERIVELADQAQAIGEIISTVNDLAEQTNLLALNAAIEAARAGEHGRGFAVVAGEVKNLAEQSKQGTARVRQILEQIQRATTAAVSATEQGNRRATDAVRQVREAGDTIRQLSEAASTASQAAAQIAASAGQQSTGMSQIRQAIGSIQQAAQQNLAATRQAEAAAQELNRVGSRLLDLVGTQARPVSAGH